MKIAFVQSKDSLPSIFSQKSLDLLGKMGELVFNDGAGTPEQVKKTIKGADIAITSWGNGLFTEDILNETPDLKLIAHAAGTVKVFVTDAVWERGIRVTGSPKPIGEGVGETALGFTISACKNFYNFSSIMHEGGWNGGSNKDVTDVYEIVIGVIGAGWAGRHYIKLLKNFDVEVLLYDPFVDEQKAEAMGVKKVDLETLLKESDVVSLHAPSIPETHHMLNAKTFALMKKEAVLINTARGSLIDENALIEHMKAGNLKYACLDVYDPEPPAKDSPLRDIPNLIMTPHTAGTCTNGRRKIGAHIVSELELFIAGKRMECEVTQDMLATMA